MEQDEWAALHLESHNTLPSECVMCLREEKMVLIKLDGDKGMIVAHESEIEKI